MFASKLQYESYGFQAGYFSNLFTLEANNFWFIARNNIILWSMNKYLQFKTGLYLEVGCGTGYVLSAVANKFSQLSVFGSEVFVVALPYAKRRTPSAELFQIDARNIPFINHFDTLGAFDILEHIPEDDLVLQQMHRALRPHGLLFLTVPQHPWLWSESDVYACHFRRYISTDLFGKLEKFGFKIELTTSFVTLLLPVMTLSRLLATKSEYTPEKELTIPFWLNHLLFAVMSLELFFIKLGLRFPFGGSRLVVVRKL